MLNQSSSRREGATLPEEGKVLRYGVLGAGVLIAILAVIGFAWYGYPMLQWKTDSATQLQKEQNRLDDLAQRLKAADAKFESLRQGDADLRNQMTKLQQNVAAGIANARKQAGQTTSSILQQVSTQIDGKVQGIQTRLSRLETSKATTDEQIAGLRQQLEQVRGAMTQQANELRATRDDLQSTTKHALLEREALSQGDVRLHQDFDAIRDTPALRRTDFEVVKNRDQQLADGSFLHVTGTDITHRRVTGWVWLMPDRRTLWLHGQAAQEPVIYYGYRDGKKRELIFTNVTKNNATGYLLLPNDAKLSAAN